MVDPYWIAIDIEGMRSDLGKKCGLQSLVMFRCRLQKGTCQLQFRIGNLSVALLHYIMEIKWADGGLQID